MEQKNDYILMLWTIVAANGGGYGNISYDWRPMGEFHYTAAATFNERPIEGLAKCEQAARDMGLKAERYRCVRSK